MLNTFNGDHKNTSIFQPYYTKSLAIVNAMVDNLRIEEGQVVLEPCGGDGVFIDAILANRKNNIIDVYELDNKAIQILESKYAECQNVKIFHGDFLIDTNLQMIALSGGVYDRIIANPPYGAWQDASKRKLLKNLFPDLYVKETYTLFLYRCIQLLKVGGRLTFIIPDTFLNLHRHTELRYRLLNHCLIRRIQLFPSHFFPDVNFGYAGLCIITLEKATSTAIAQDNVFTVETNYSSVRALQHPEGVKKHFFRQQDILRQPDAALFIAEDPIVTKSITLTSKCIGDIADCVTGFYSGNDKFFLRSASTQNRNDNKYQPFNSSLDFAGHSIPLEGIDDDRCYIPIVKGGNTRYYKHNTWYINWSRKAVEHYRTSKKARFQNAQFYFHEGIGVPMVSSTSITASLLDCRLFDQSIVGIFPHDLSYMYYLCIYSGVKPVV